MVRRVCGGWNSYIPKLDLSISVRMCSEAVTSQVLLSIFFPYRYDIGRLECNFHSPLLVKFSCSVTSDSLQPHGLQHPRLSCPSPPPRAYLSSCPLSWRCHQTISSSVVPFSSHLQCFLASGSFPRSQFFTSGSQSIRVSVSASVLPVNIQDWFPLGWTDWISLQSRGLSRVFPNTTVQKHLVFGAQLYGPTLTCTNDYWKYHSFD